MSRNVCFGVTNTSSLPLKRFSVSVTRTACSLLLYHIREPSPTGSFHGLGLGTEADVVLSKTS